ncbi:hypothetical protein A3Q56_04161 [Intoshia linei]|uniref:Homeobox domain-containing protein n=1 Tax=Intoshia linei TaxID=1819745 RepID=A0A177B3D0_9BILA|nr:hypothetical protein A3Q56_04161 [Intoshia linei]
MDSIDKLQEDKEDGQSKCDQNDKNETKTKIRRRGPRTSISGNKLSILRYYYNRNPKPNKDQRDEIGKQVGLASRVVQVWFQNCRSKERKFCLHHPDMKHFEHSLHNNEKFNPFLSNSNTNYLPMTNYPPNDRPRQLFNHPYIPNKNFYTSIYSNYLFQNNSQYNVSKFD